MQNEILLLYRVSKATTSEGPTSNKFDDSRFYPDSFNQNDIYLSMISFEDILELTNERSFGPSLTFRCGN